MARKEDMSDYQDGIYNYTVFVVNETSVGKSGQNSKRSDIQLVQFFLRQFFKKNPTEASKLPSTKSGRREMQIDGKYGKQTEIGIGLFQNWCQKQGKGIKVDHLVSVPHSLKGANAGNYFTILHMNAWFDKYCDDDDRGMLEHNVDLVTYAPELLRDLIYKPVTNKI